MLFSRVTRQWQQRPVMEIILARGPQSMVSEPAACWSGKGQVSGEDKIISGKGK